MGILTEDMKRLVDEQQLGFHATVCPDGSPNLSPKGTTRVWDDDHLFFGDICSPQTIANLQAGSLIELNVVDPFVRKGYRFKGPAVIREPGSAEFAEGIEQLRADGSPLTDRVKVIVVIEVQRAEPLISPVYDDGTTTEADMIETHRARFARIHERRAGGRAYPDRISNAGVNGAELTTRLTFGSDQVDADGEQCPRRRRAGAG